MDVLVQSRSLAEAAPGLPRITNVLLIVNPGSRSGTRAVDAVLVALRDAGVEVEAVETTGPRDATRIVRDRVTARASSYDAVLTLGGDGTAMEAASALAGIADAPPLGIIAVGTANVLARTVGIPLSPVRAVRALLDADAVTIDLGRVADGPAFAIGLGVGLDASMIGGASSIMKRRIGYAAYVLSALRACLRLERFTARIVVDGVVHEADTSSVLVANFGTVLGDLVCFAENTGPRDGLLDVCLYSPRSMFDAARILWHMLFGGVSEDRCVRIIRGSHIRIETDPPRPTQADGELLGMTPVEINVEPGALKLLVPRTTSRRWRFRRQPTANLRSATPESCTP